MNKLFYPRLAATNIKNNSKTYFPFIITCICTIAMFYIMDALAVNKGLGSASLKSMLTFGTAVIGIFSAIFLFYTNSFLIKRRKKEIGLYNVLGLEKKHIARVMFFECIFTSVISLAVGLIVGIILNKLMFLLLLKILNFKVAYGFYVSVSSMVKTLILFTGIFFVTLLSNLFQIKMSKPIELLKGTQHGEKEPKTKWIMTVIGVIALGTGYGIAIKVQAPLAALGLFFIAVILVMIGTYALFTAGSIAVLKLLRKNNKFYYKTSNFISVSGMMYRMKQNAVGLANICILSTAVLVMISTTVALYVGMEDVIRNRYPRNIVMTATQITDSQAQKANTILEAEAKNNNIGIKNKVDHWENSFPVIKKDGKFSITSEDDTSTNVSFIVIIPVSDYNRLEGKNITLAGDEAVIFSKAGNYDKNNITIENKTLKIKQVLDKPMAILDHGIDNVLDTNILLVNNIDSIGKENNKEYLIGVDVQGRDKEILALSNKLKDKFKESGIKFSVESSAGSREDFLMVYGGLLFLGIFLGALFLMATVLIIYYKQISEGYDDKERFEIMQKVGMSKKEIRKTIRSQVLMVFFLPLAAAVIHIAFAFPMITKLLAVLNLKNTALFMLSTIMTILVFAVIYAIIFSLTAREYYKIVE